jgi:DNA-binding FrmR family transcriptional regulator
MTHVTRDQKKLLSRVRRIGGQIAALEKAMEADIDCGQVLVQIAAVRGAVHGLMMEVLSGHLQEHVVAEADEQQRAREIAVVTDLMRTYVK